MNEATRLRSELMGLDRDESTRTQRQNALRCIVLGRPPVRTFDGLPEQRRMACLLLQERLFEWRSQFETTDDPAKLRELARELPRLDQHLSNRATGWLLRHPRPPEGFFVPWLGESHDDYIRSCEQFDEAFVDE